MHAQKITKANAVKLWREYHKADVKRQFPKDKAALRESWTNWTDYLCKEGHITMRQYETWTQPPECK